MATATSPPVLSTAPLQLAARPGLQRFARWLAVATVLVGTHLATASYFAARYAGGEVGVAGKPLTLDLSQDAWATITAGADSSAYLRVARQVAAGNGVVAPFPGAVPPRTGPFTYWGPGAPVALGIWLRLVGGDSMRTFFWFAVASQLCFGAITLATVSLYTKNFWALAATAICTGFCPPLQLWFYGDNLTSSEIVSLVPIALSYFALAKGFLAYRAVNCGRRLNAAAWRAVGWFAVASLMIGVYSLVRDSGTVFATFTACFLAGRAILKLDRPRLAVALLAAFVLIAGVQAVRQPVRTWNKRRMGFSLVCASSEGCIWRYGLWMKHDAADWIETAGLGMGEYLDPAAAKRVEDYYLAGGPQPEWYSLKQFVPAVLNRPRDALQFKLVRLPVLWLATNRWPNVHLNLASYWCLAFYATFVALVVIHLRRRQYLPEPLYLYLLLLICASALIHYEFRYTLPIWSALVMAPGLLIAAFAEKRSLPTQQSVSQLTTDD